MSDNCDTPMPVIYIVRFNKCLIGLVTPPSDPKDDKPLRESSMLRLMNNVGFENVADYQNHLPGHSDKDMVGHFIDSWGEGNGIFVYTFHGKDTGNNNFSISFEKWHYYGGMFVDIRDSIFRDGNLSRECQFLLYPTIKEFEQNLIDTNWIKPEAYLLYCTDWKGDID